MEFTNVQNEYAWVIEVLESCLTESQISTSEKLFRQFIMKWKNEIPDERKEKLNDNFGKLVKIKTFELRKNYESTSSNNCVGTK